VREGFKGKTGYLLLALGVLGLDQWSKWWVEGNIRPGSPIRVIDGFLDLTLVKNTGVAFGLFPARGEMTGIILLTLLGLLALGVVTAYFWKTPRDERLLLTSLALILGGAVGNLADRIAAGAVTDFIDVYFRSYHWHTFNVADSAITVGIGLMILEILRSRPSESDEPEPATKEAPAGVPAEDG
jgi:signal peptidase II